VLDSPVIIVGSGLAGYGVARELRKLAPDRELVIISRDDARSYSKPSLSNALALGKTANQLGGASAETMSTQLRARVLANAEVRDIDIAHRKIALDGETLAYSKLVLALGADPISVPLAGNAADEVQRVNDLASYASFRAAIEGDKQLDLQVLSEPTYYEKTSEGTALLMTFLGGAIVFFLSLGAMIGGMITMYGAVDSRKREIGTLRALGFTRLQVLGSFLFESALLALCGGVIGAFAALGMGFVKIGMMNQATWSEMVFSFDPTPDIVIGSVIAGAVMGILGGFLPAARAARVSPIAAMRE